MDSALMKLMLDRIMMEGITEIEIMKIVITDNFSAAWETYRDRDKERVRDERREPILRHKTYDEECLLSAPKRTRHQETSSVSKQLIVGHGKKVENLIIRYSEKRFHILSLHQSQINNNKWHGHLY